MTRGKVKGMRVTSAGPRLGRNCFVLTRENELFSLGFENRFHFRIDRQCAYPFECKLEITETTVFMASMSSASLQVLHFDHPSLSLVTNI